MLLFYRKKDTPDMLWSLSPNVKFLGQTHCDKRYFEKVFAKVESRRNEWQMTFYNCPLYTVSGKQTLIVAYKLSENCDNEWLQMSMHFLLAFPTQ